MDIAWKYQPKSYFSINFLKQNVDLVVLLLESSGHLSKNINLQLKWNGLASHFFKNRIVQANNLGNFDTLCQQFFCTKFQESIWEWKDWSNRRFSWWENLNLTYRLPSGITFKMLIYFKIFLYSAWNLDFMIYT